MLFYLNLFIATAPIEHNKTRSRITDSDCGRGFFAPSCTINKDQVCSRCFSLRRADTSCARRALKVLGPYLRAKISPEGAEELRVVLLDSFPKDAAAEQPPSGIVGHRSRPAVRGI